MNFQNAEIESTAYLPSQLPFSDLREIVFSGKSNVGKSSLINRLLNRKRLARVSSEPGKTASVNFYRCENIRLVDLPGYGFARVSKEEKDKWSELVEGYFGNPRRIHLVVQLIDIRHKLSADDGQMLGYLSEMNIPYAVALTKSDKLNKTEMKKRMEEIPTESPYYNGITMVVCSAQSGEGIDKLKSVILDALDKPIQKI